MPGKTLLPQEISKFERLGRAEGLSQGSVNCMLRDREGFMWFGTQDGLNRYDGKRFRVFQHQPGDDASLSNNYILSITEDERGMLWIGTMAGGLNSFDKKTETFRVYNHSDKQSSITENTVWAVLSDKNGSVWIGTSKGLNRYDINHKTFNAYLPVPNDTTSLTTEMVVSLFRDSRGQIWAGTVEGLCLLTNCMKSFKRYSNPWDKYLKGANLIWSISETATGEIVTGTNNGVYLLNPSTGNYRKIFCLDGEKQTVAWAVSATGPGIIWAGTDKGLFKIREGGDRIQSFISDKQNPLSIPNNIIWCLMADPSGCLWAGTNEGICRTRTTPALFHLLTDKPDSELRLSSAKVMAVLEDRQGNLWVGTDGGGLNFFSHNRQVSKVFNCRNSGLVNDNIWALAEDRSGNIYIGSYQGGLQKWDHATGKIKAYPFNRKDKYSLCNPRVLALLVAKDGNVWIGTRGGGLSRLDPVTGIFVSYQHTPDDRSGFPSNTVLSLAEDAEERIWAGTHEGGLALYVPEEARFRVFSNQSDDPSSISDNYIWSVKFDTKGRLWAGTQGGLNVCEQPGQKSLFHHFTTLEGLPGNAILALQTDHSGNIWMSSFSGLVKLNISAYESLIKGSTEDASAVFNPLFYRFDTDHGLQGLEYNPGCSYRGLSGRIYFGGNNGLNYFSESEVKLSSFHPPVVLTGFRIFNRDAGIMGNPEPGNPACKVRSDDGRNYYLPEKITFVEELELSYRESVISFDFASLDFTNSRKNLYAYKMLNFDEDWNYIGTQNTATYTNLDPGEYTLLIKGSNSDGIWNPDEKSLKIIISPPFWKTPWFIILSGFIVLLSLFLSVRRIVMNQQRKARGERELIELQLKSIKSQIDPHFAFNALNTVAGLIYSEKPDVTYDYFTRFAWMIRNILEDNEKISRPLSEELDFVRNYLELQKMRFKERLEYLILTDKEVQLSTLIPKMIIQSYAENAIKHGVMHRKSGGLLTICIWKQNQDLHVSIEDNGVGRERAAELNQDSTHKGFRIMEQIISLYSKLYHTRITQQIDDLKDDEGIASGTRVTLILYPNS